MITLLTCICNSELSSKFVTLTCNTYDANAFLPSSKCILKKRTSEAIPCCAESCSCPVQFVGGQGTSPLSYVRGSQLGKPEAYIFLCHLQSLSPFHPRMTFQT